VDASHTIHLFERKNESIFFYNKSDHKKTTFSTLTIAVYKLIVSTALLLLSILSKDLQPKVYQTILRWFRYKF